jgi:hypothetical protein
MAKYVVTFNNGTVDIICSSYESAVNLNIEGWCSIYCAPDKTKKWRAMATIPENIEVWIKFFDMPQRATRHGKEIVLSDIAGTHYPLNLFDGWLPMDWFRYVKPDDAAMAWWQQEDEYGDR